MLGGPALCLHGQGGSKLLPSNALCIGPGQLWLKNVTTGCKQRSNDQHGFSKRWRAPLLCSAAKETALNVSGKRDDNRHTEPNTFPRAQVLQKLQKGQNLPFGQLLWQDRLCPSPELFTKDMPGKLHSRAPCYAAQTMYHPNQEPTGVALSHSQLIFPCSEKS